MAPGAAEAEGGFSVDLADPRFSEMFQDHSFALDPTDPRCGAYRCSNKRSSHWVV